VPFTFVGVAAAMAGLNWIIERRRKLQEHPEQEEEAKEVRDDG